MVCLNCRRVAGGRGLCADCRSRLMAAPDRYLPEGLLVRSGLVHDGPARQLVHQLKYQGLRPAARILAEHMVDQVPEGVLVPIPRVLTRRWRYGIDPAHELARALSHLTGRPVVRLLTAPWWWPRHAGAERQHRPAPAFRGGYTTHPAVLIDDVITTGATLLSAAAAVDTPRLSAVTATSAQMVTSLYTRTSN